MKGWLIGALIGFIFWFINIVFIYLSQGETDFQKMSFLTATVVFFIFGGWIIVPVTMILLFGVGSFIGWLIGKYKKK